MVETVEIIEDKLYVLSMFKSSKKINMTTKMVTRDRAFPFLIIQIITNYQMPAIIALKNVKYLTLLRTFSSSTSKAEAGRSLGVGG